MGDSSDSYHPPPPPGVFGAGRKKKKKQSARLITGYRLPRLDEMVLLQPISTRADGTSKEEKTRVENINERLETYNRWLAFVPESKPGRSIRNAAVEMQHSVHDLNATIADLLIQVDQRIADLQDRTEEFVLAVQDGGSWQTKGDLLDLTYDELDAILQKHPDRNTETYGRHLCQTIRAAPTPIYDFVYTWPGLRFLDKLLRLIKDVEICPGLVADAFHLFIFVKSDLLVRYRQNESFGACFPTREDYERIDKEALELVHRSTSAVPTRCKPTAPIYFNFALASRDMSKGFRRLCRSCNWSPSPPLDPFAAVFSNPPQSCLRAPHLKLLDKVQKLAYGEIRCGVMLLGKRLPKEICLLVFEFAMEAESVPLDPRVWNEDEYLAGMTIRGGLKPAYTCTNRAGRGRRDSLDDLSSFDL